ncbi:Colicin I receptor [Pseudomonas syringae pv. actinidiae]|nr:Colicin I receptor [Pseudomonas syringae pv. actinidiae]OSN77025.1 Colicin I receptor [Pseudomonas syringae pv. actinidiae]
MALPARAICHTLRTPLIKGMALVSLGLMNPAQAADKSAEEEARLEKVTVISTGVRGTQRTVTDSPAPVDIVTSDQLLKTGRADLTEAIAKLLPSFNYGTNVAGYNSTIRPLSNRSLAPAYTLVLVNGKRRHNSALPANGSTDSSGANSVDIDMIPISAVERIEVLKDSAAAQYGSDAIAGVINVILKSSAEGGHLGVTYGKLYSGEGEVSKFEGYTGFELGNGGFLHLSADARKRGDASWNEKATNNAYFPGDPREATRKSRRSTWPTTPNCRWMTRQRCIPTAPTGSATPSSTTTSATPTATPTSPSCSPTAITRSTTWTTLTIST